MNIFWWRRPKDDFYITLLKYARDKTVNGMPLKFSEAVKHVTSIHGKFNEGVLENIFREVVDEPIGFETGNLNTRLEDESTVMLNVEAYFQLLEHEEMEQARSSSKWALWVAIAAIFITLVVSAASLIVPLIYPTNVEVDFGRMIDL